MTLKLVKGSQEYKTQITDMLAEWIAASPMMDWFPTPRFSVWMMSGTSWWVP